MAFISRGGDGAYPVLYLEDFSNEETVEGALDRILGLIKDHCDFDFNIPNSYAQIKNHLFVKAIGFDGNSEFLKDAVYGTREDIALVVYVRVSENSCYKLPQEVVDRFGVDGAEVFNDAMQNLDYCVFPMGSVIPGAGEEILIISNKDGYFGASSIFARGVADKLTESFKGGCYLLPSSVHEVLAIPAGDEYKAKELADMVRSINRATVSVEERLTDSVYFLDANGGFKRVA